MVAAMAAPAQSLVPGAGRPVAVAMAFVLTVGCILVFDNDSGLWTQIGFGGGGLVPEGPGETSLAELCRLRGLTTREAEVAAFLAEGRSYKVIAEKLLVSQDTIKGHVKAIYQKFDVHTKQDFIELVSSVESSEEVR